MPGKPIDIVLNACSARGLNTVQKSGWYRCPHPCSPDGDKRMSFSFQEQADGVVCVKSFKGYSTEDALTALGLTWADCYPPKVTTYDYRDRNGNRVGYVKRTPDKEFFQGRIENGKAVSGLNGVKLPLYLSPQVDAWLLEGKPIFVVEGEKDALSLASRGYPATTKAGGAESKWEDSNSQVFDGADVTIVADADEAGEKAAKAAFTALYPFARSIRIVEAKVGKDATDHLEAGFTPEEFVQRDDLVPPPTTKSGRIVVCTDIADLQDEGAPEGVRTGFRALDDRSICRGLAKGQMSVVCAKPKHGKSAFMCQVAANACKQFYRVCYVTLADLTKSDVFSRIRRIETGWAETPDNLEYAEAWREQIEGFKTDWDLKFLNAKDVGGWHVEDVCEGIEAVHKRHRFDLVVIDYAQKMTSLDHPDRVRATERVSTLVSQMASERGFAILLGSQQTDDGKAWYSREFSADCSLLMHLNAPNGRDAPEREIYVEHQRFGPSDFTRLATWDNHRLCFKENA